jgi:hypothetical protein
MSNPVLRLFVGAFASILISSPAALAAPKAKQVSVSYVPPKNPEHQAIYDGLKERRSLEKLQEFLSPFRLPRTLKISLAGCNGEADAFYGEGLITICYEYIEELWKRMPVETTVEGIAPIDMVVGPLFDTSLHEFGHALFDLFKLPILGREEDAADQVAAYISLQLGKDDARRLIGGTVLAYKSDAERAGEAPSLKQFSDEHSLPAQRAYNLLCIAYGADSKEFGGLVSKGYLPAKRAQGCETEYEQIQDAFEKLISPHIDRRLAAKVLDKSWLPAPTSRIARSLKPRPPQP